ncbi:MAG: ABC transporter permease [Gaiellaceae bacterium]
MGAAAVELPAAVERSRFRRFLRRFPMSARLAALLLIAYVVIALSGPLWTPYDPFQISTGLPYSGSSGAHLFGTDILGRDVFSRVVYGTRDVLYLALTSTFLALVLGAAVGLASGLVGGWIDELLMRLFETIISIPLLVLALLAIAAAGPKASGKSLLLIGVVVLVYAPRIARMARTVAVDLVTRDFVTVARARGESVRSIVWRELTPNAAGVLLVEFGVRAGYAPILISSLGFLGFGARPPSPEWGLMISENRAALVTAPLTVLAPAAALALLVISLNLVTDGIARALGRSVERTP